MLLIVTRHSEVYEFVNEYFVDELVHGRIAFRSGRRVSTSVVEVEEYRRVEESEWEEVKKKGVLVPYGEEYLLACPLGFGKCHCMDASSIQCFEDLHLSDARDCYYAR